MAEGSCNLNKFELICATTIGASHTKTGMPCEDFGLVKESDGCIVFAVADGHGDSNCPRSAYGSRRACEIACDELVRFAKDAREATYKNDRGEELLWESKLLDPNLSGQLIRQLVVSIVGNWRDDVLGDLEANPLSESERSEASAYIARYDRGERLEHIYGTTLIAGLATERYLLLLQQGDGRCVMFDMEGSESQPIPWDDACFANVTTSMCDENAVDEFRHYVRDLERESIAACFVGTDGVEDSFFSMEQMHAYYRRLLIDAASGCIRECEERLRASLPEFSACGSGDDVTICGVIDVNAVRLLAQELEDKNASVDLKGELARIDDRLRSMSGKLSYLETRMHDIENAEEGAAKDARDAWEERERWKKDSEVIGAEEESFLKHLSRRCREWLLAGVEEHLNESESQLKEAQVVLSDASEDSVMAREEYESYLATYKSILARREELITALEGKTSEVSCAFEHTTEE